MPLQPREHLGVDAGPSGSEKGMILVGVVAVTVTEEEADGEGEDGKEEEHDERRRG